MVSERITALRRKWILTFAESAELDRLLEEQARLTGIEQERQARLAKEREGKQAFILNYRRGNIFQKTEDMDQISKEIWAADSLEAAEEACKIMVEEERWNPTGIAITDALSARLNVYKGNQLEKHNPIWVNPYSIAPSQQANGGPFEFAEIVVKDLTGKDINIADGNVGWSPNQESR